MLQFSFLLCGSGASRMREMVGEFIRKSPDEMRDTIIAHQFMYKDLLPLDIHFIFCEDPVIAPDLVERFGEFADLLFTFDLNDAESFRALTPEIIDTVKEAVHNKNPILIGYDPVGEPGRRVSRDEILTFAQQQDMCFYFEVTPKTKFDFKALFQRLVKEDLAEFKLKFPDQYDEEVKEARRAAQEAKRKAEEESAE